MKLLVLASSGCLAAQTASHSTTISTAEQVLALADDVKATAKDLNQVQRALDSLEPTRRKSALRKLIASPNLRLAALAAKGAITEGDTDAVSLISAHVAEWSLGDQSQILQLLTPGRDAFIEIPRCLVRATLKRGKIVEVHDPLMVGAASALARTGRPADGQMLLELATLRPKSPYVWIAVAYAGAMDPSRARLASSVYRDEKLPLPLRVAAASALQSLDSQALAFTNSQINSFLARFAGQGIEPMLAAMQQPKPPAVGSSEYSYYLADSPILSALAVLKTAAVERTVFEYITAPNQLIRNWCGAVAAARWPERLLKLGQGSFSDQEYADLLAFTVIKHPSLESAAESLVAPGQIEKSRSRIAEFGLVILAASGNVLLLY